VTEDELPQRCWWCGSDELYQAYHDREWGVPVQSDQQLFEFLTLETMQAGLSWLTVLKKRESFRSAFDGFVAEKVAAYDEDKVQQLLQDTGIIRNRLKIRAAISNAQAFLRIQAKLGSFAAYMWSFTDGQPVVNHWRTAEEVPARSTLSDRFSHDLKRRGFKFVGSIICYSHLQATGVVMDHLTSCYRHAQLAQVSS